jgi:hypothetical protein
MRRTEVSVTSTLSLPSADATGTNTTASHASPRPLAFLSTILVLAMFPALTAQHQVQAEVEINAPPELVWQILTDLAGYTIWNPYVYPASGEIRAGAQLDITLHSGTGVIEFQPTVVTVQPNHILRWRGQTFTFGVFDRDQTFTLEPLGADRSRLIAQETFTGLLTSLSGNVQGDAQRGLDEMSRALRDRAEIMRLTVGARK